MTRPGTRCAADVYKRQGVHRARGALHAFLLAGELDLRAPADRRYPKFLLQQTDVFVTASEYQQGGIQTVQFDLTFGHVTSCKNAVLPGIGSGAKTASVLMLLYHILVGEV